MRRSPPPLSLFLSLSEVLRLRSPISAARASRPTAPVRCLCAALPLTDAAARAERNSGRVAIRRDLVGVFVARSDIHCCPLLPHCRALTHAFMPFYCALLLPPHCCLLPLHAFLPCPHTAAFLPDLNTAACPPASASRSLPISIENHRLTPTPVRLVCTPLFSERPCSSTPVHARGRSFCFSCSSFLLHTHSPSLCTLFFRSFR